MSDSDNDDPWAKANDDDGENELLAGGRAPAAVAAEYDGRLVPW